MKTSKTKTPKAPKKARTRTRTETEACAFHDAQAVLDLATSTVKGLLSAVAGSPECAPGVEGARDRILWIAAGAAAATNTLIAMVHATPHEVTHITQVAEILPPLLLAEAISQHEAQVEAEPSRPRRAPRSRKVAAKVKATVLQ